MLFVSCQPYKDEEYYTKEFFLNMASAAKLGGASGLRIEGIENIIYVKKKIDLPIIGLIKNKIKDKLRYICPTLEHIDNVLDTNCNYIAIDYTLRDNLEKKDFINITKYIRSRGKSRIIADISTIEEARMAKECKVDLISTAMRGFTEKTNQISIPDIEFIKQLSKEKIDGIIAEGGYSTNSQYKKALENGAKIIVIGTAITRPHLIVKKILTGSYF